MHAFNSICQAVYFIFCSDFTSTTIKINFESCIGYSLIYYALEETVFVLQLPDLALSLLTKTDGRRKSPVYEVFCLSFCYG
jgi:hypothetical protein